MKQLILGGARSGKSREAESRALALAQAKPLQLIYIATGQALDKEMQKRITHHQENRDTRWQLIEEPLALAETLKKHSTKNTCILVDCLTLWLSNCLHHKQWPDAANALYQSLDECSGHIIFVSNEVGQGIVPNNPLSREFVDEAGRLHQELAQLCQRVSLIVAGLSMEFKTE